MISNVATMCNIFDLQRLKKLSEQNKDKLDQWEKEQKELLFNQWFYASGIPERYKKAKTNAQWDGKKNVFLIGEVGTGKTFTACSLLLRYGRGFYTTMFDIKQKLKQYANFSNKVSEYEYLQDLACNSILVLDEVGRVQKEFEAETIFYLVNERYNKSLPTILCSNLELKSLEQYLGSATMDRLKDNFSLMNIKGGSKRGSKM